MNRQGSTRLLLPLALASTSSRVKASVVQLRSSHHYSSSPSRIATAPRAGPQWWLFTRFTVQKHRPSRKPLCRDKQSCRKALPEQHLSSALNTRQGAVGQGPDLRSRPLPSSCRGTTSLEEPWRCSPLRLAVVVHLADKQEVYQVLN